MKNQLKIPSGMTAKIYSNFLTNELMGKIEDKMPKFDISKQETMNGNNKQVQNQCDENSECIHNQSINLNKEREHDMEGKIPNTEVNHKFCSINWAHKTEKIPKSFKIDIPFSTHDERIPLRDKNNNKIKNTNRIENYMNIFFKNTNKQINNNKIQKDSIVLNDKNIMDNIVQGKNKNDKRLKFREIYNHDKLNQLLNLPYKEFLKIFFNNNTENKHTKKIHKNLKKYKKNSYNKGEITIDYHYRENDPDKLEKIFCEKQIGLQSFGNEINGFMTDNNYYDINLKNFHPIILWYICNINNIKCPTLTEYIKNKDNIIKHIVDLNKNATILSIKKTYLSILSGRNSIDPSIITNSIHLNNFKKEMMQIATELRNIYPKIFEYIECRTPKKTILYRSINGIFLATLCNRVESHILNIIINFSYNQSFFVLFFYALCLPLSFSCVLFSFFFYALFSFFSCVLFSFFFYVFLFFFPRCSRPFLRSHQLCVPVPPVFHVMMLYP